MKRLDDLGGQAVYQLNRDQMESLANKLMEQLETMAHYDGLIADKHLFSRNYVITLIRPNTLTRIFDKLFMRGVEDNTAVFKVLAVPADLSEYDPDEEEQQTESRQSKIAKLFTLHTGGKKKEELKE